MIVSDAPTDGGIRIPRIPKDRIHANEIKNKRLRNKCKEIYMYLKSVKVGLESRRPTTSTNAAK
jgi:hypothetical protein